jgi:predicted glycogen debranching enzyme
MVAPGRRTPGYSGGPVVNPGAEWLETDGLGGYAMGRVDLVRSRRYHALLTTATTPPTGRVVLVNGVEVWLESGDQRIALTSNRYVPDVTFPDGASRLSEFSSEPWPTWRYLLPDGNEVIQELVMRHGTPLVALSWRLARPAAYHLRVRPFMSGRDQHSTHHENASFDFAGAVSGPRVTWKPYPALPAVMAVTNGEYLPAPDWYRHHQLDEERSRGLDHVEDLASPGTILFDLSDGPALLALAAESEYRTVLLDGTAETLWRSVTERERERRAQFASPWHRAADAYVVRRGQGTTIVAGYPWFSDWGRDTFIALRGLCLAGDRLDDARNILLEWSQHVNQGMLPNFFPEGGAEPEYNSVDASLWFVIAAHELLQQDGVGITFKVGERARLQAAIDAIVVGYARGTRFGIGATDDGLLAAGVPGVQLTWMDAKVGEWVVTPRIGKPVEVQALWINALRIAGRRSPTWNALADHAQASFRSRFLNEAGYLHDVVDVAHVPGTVDATFRPNQILAVGGLPYRLLDGAEARRIVDAVEQRLWTVAGLRSLEPHDAAYVPHYAGDVRARDGAYHQGTVWPWLAGAFIDAWTRVHAGTSGARQEARDRFLGPLLAHYTQSGIGHIAEIADADPPFAPRGCPFQAWSVGEVLRIDREILRHEVHTPVSVTAIAAPHS